MALTDALVAGLARRGLKAVEPVVFLTERELEELGEYSCSMPTGVYPGKRWKRNKNAYYCPTCRKNSIGACGHASPGLPPEWWLGEYREHPDPEKRERFCLTVFTRIRVGGAAS